MIHIEHLNSFYDPTNILLREIDAPLNSEVLAKFDFSKVFIYATYATGIILIYITDLVNNTSSSQDLQHYKDSLQLLKHTYQEFYIALNGKFFQISKDILSCFLQYYFDLNALHLSS